MEKSKKDKKKHSGFPGDCSPDHLAALEQFRGFVLQLCQGQPDPQWDDAYLLRFLRARKFVLKETQKMWADFVAWRNKHGLNDLKNFYFPQLPALRKIYPHGHHKYDKQYRPIYIERVGQVNIDEVKKLVNQPTLLRYFAQGYEVLLTTVMEACSRQKALETGDNTPVTQTCNIVDLKGFKITQASKAYDFVKPASEMGQNYYPQILGNMFIINAPMLFTGVWAIVKMWIDEKTREKIHILGSSYKKELLKYIDPECLPDFIDGGTCKCKGGDCLSLNIGPWNPEGNELHPHCLVKHQPPLKSNLPQEKPQVLAVKQKPDRQEEQLKEQLKKEQQGSVKKQEQKKAEEEGKGEERQQQKILGLDPPKVVPVFTSVQQSGESSKPMLQGGQV